MKIWVQVTAAKSIADNYCEIFAKLSVSVSSIFQQEVLV